MADLIKQYHADMTTLISPAIDSCGASAHAYFTRTGGVSTGQNTSLNFRHVDDDPANIRENCTRAAAKIGREYRDIIRTKQEHTDKIAVVREWAEGMRVAFNGTCGCDGLITNVPKVALMGFYADCQLLLFCDPKNRAVGAVHSGWRGTAQSIAEKTVRLMGENYGTKPADLRVSIGPSICQDCFETDGDVYNELTGEFGEKAAEFCYKKGEKYHFDTKAITLWRLLEAGVKRENIDVSEDCTCCGSGELYWSHRRQGLERGVHAGMIAVDEVTDEK